MALAGLIQVARWSLIAVETMIGEPVLVFFAKQCAEEAPCIPEGPENASSHFSIYYFVGVRLVDPLGPRGWP